MEMSEEVVSGARILGLSNRLDAVTSKPVEERILGLIDGGDHRLVVDLSRLEYVSSAGLRVLLLAAKRMKAAGGRLAVCSPTDHVRQVFEISGFASVLSVYGSRDEAIGHVTGGN